MAERDKMIKGVEQHLRMTARQLVKFDTEEEALQYLTNAFQSKLKCDFVGIVLKEGDYLVPKVWSGGFETLKSIFPLRISECYHNLFQQSLTFNDMQNDSGCKFLHSLQQAPLETWFTVPLQDESNNYGFCTIGFIKYTRLLDMDHIFEEFGRDAAVALSMAKQKENERKKIVGMEWVSRNLSLNESVENLVARLVDRAGRGTEASLAGIYLYNETENCFTFQPPSYGDFNKPKKIYIEENYELKEYFPYVEKPGGDEMSVPMVIDLKTIGVLHIEGKTSGVFSSGDLEILELLANHVAAMLENARLYHSEKDNKQRLQSLLDYQQTLIKETVDQDNFEGITSALSKLFAKPVILFDRFMRPISYDKKIDDGLELEEITKLAGDEINKDLTLEEGFPVIDKQDRIFTIWPVNGGADLLGYLAVQFDESPLDNFDRLTIDMARNIYAIQFIKQKLVLDAKEQVKDSFVDKLLVENIDDKQSIIQYANIFQWDLFNTHRVAVLSIYLDKSETRKDNILEKEAKKSLVLDQLKTRISMYEPDILLANKGEDYILIAPAEKEEVNAEAYWERLIGSINKWLGTGKIRSRARLGIGGITNDIDQYYQCYQQAVEALNVIDHQGSEHALAFFENLGSYTLLHHLKDTTAAHLFMEKRLEPLLNYSKNADLFHTLRVYLNENGHIKNAASSLYIHRSSLLYRLEKIETTLHVDLSDSEQRFDLFLAYKLYDLKQNNQ
ncbi:helix-turn-helix domain-containing protein [Salibacterium aidingense]|uniref:helix-turn-helix domain-containing protein n=1 Tax=Salibacterium aidingense TaxID=384933 RepID=UPI003BD47D52